VLTTTATIRDGMHETKVTLGQITARKDADHARMKFLWRRRALHRVQRLRHRLQERSRGARASTPARRHINTAGRSTLDLEACMHCKPTLPISRGLSVSRLYTTAAPSCCTQDALHGCGSCFRCLPFGAPQYPKVRQFRFAAARWTNARYCRGPEAENSKKNPTNTSRTASPKGKRRLLLDLARQIFARLRRGDIIAQI